MCTCIDNIDNIDNVDICSSAVPPRPAPVLRAELAPADSAEEVPAAAVAAHQRPAAVPEPQRGAALGVLRPRQSEP